MQTLNKRKGAWDSLTRGAAVTQIPKDISWTAQDGRDLEDEVEKAKKGLIFFCITLPKVSAMSSSEKS